MAPATASRRGFLRASPSGPPHKGCSTPPRAPSAVGLPPKTILAGVAYHHPESLHECETIGDVRRLLQKRLGVKDLRPLRAAIDEMATSILTLRDELLEERNKIRQAERAELDAQVAAAVEAQARRAAAPPPPPPPPANPKKRGKSKQPQLPGGDSSEEDDEVGGAQQQPKKQREKKPSAKAMAAAAAADEASDADDADEEYDSSDEENAHADGWCPPPPVLPRRQSLSPTPDDGQPPPRAPVPPAAATAAAAAAKEALAAERLAEEALRWTRKGSTEHVFVGRVVRLFRGDQRSGGGFVDRRIIACGGGRWRRAATPTFGSAKEEVAMVAMVAMVRSC